MGDGFIARPLPTQDNSNTDNKPINIPLLDTTKILPGTDNFISVIIRLFKKASVLFSLIRVLSMGVEPGLSLRGRTCI
jgi:hypothetical protein